MGLYCSESTETGTSQVRSLSLAERPEVRRGRVWPPLVFAVACRSSFRRRSGELDARHRREGASVGRPPCRQRLRRAAVECAPGRVSRLARLLEEGHVDFLR